MPIDFPPHSRMYRPSRGRWLLVLVAHIAAALTNVAGAAQVTLSNLAQTYTGSQKSVTVTTVPAGLTCTVTYAGSTTAPTNAGSYAVVATVVDAVESGSATGTLVISKASQTITFAALTAKTYGDAPFSLTGTTSSGLAVTYTSSNTAVATVSGSTVTIIGAGSTNITASQAGDTNFNAATNVVRALTVNKKAQLLTLSGVPASATYGEAPFAVSAVSNSGLPVTKFECSDPSVATITGTTVTITGAGQASIIASNVATTNYLAGWVALPINITQSSSPLPTGNNQTTYDGTPQALNAAMLPSGSATEVTYRDASSVEPTASPEVVFQNGPDTLDLSYTSTGLQATGYWGMAKLASLGGTARRLHSCDVTLVSWARYDTSSPYGYQVWANAHTDLVLTPKPGISIPGDSGGYYHPVTLSFYEYSNDGTSEVYRLLTTQTVQALIPWRPARLADNATAYSYSGYAFRVPFTFPDGILLPADVWVSVSFNTNTHGTAPVGQSGPYEALNIAKPSGQQVGSTLLPSYTLPFKDWRWQSASGSSGPMLRLRAVPTTATTTAPVNAGTYEVKTKATGFGPEASSTSTLTINKAPLGITLDNLAQARDGSPKYAIVSTVPAGIATTTTYAGSVTGPSALGSYPVNSVSANPNYEGESTGTLQIGDTFTTWQTDTFQASGLPPEQTTDTADPDGDGLSNFLEYAFNLAPTVGNPSPISDFGFEGSGLAMNYRRNVHALDIDYVIEATTNLTDPLSWTEVIPTQENTLSDDGSTQVIRATVTVPANQPRYFLRVKARR